MKTSRKCRFVVTVILLIAMACMLSGCGKGEPSVTNNYYTLTEEQFNQLLEKISQSPNTPNGAIIVGDQPEAKPTEENKEVEDEGRIHMRASYLEDTAEIKYLYHTAEEAKENVMDLQWDEYERADLQFAVTVNSEVKNVKFSPDDYQNTIPLVVDVDLENNTYVFNTGKIEKDKVYSISFDINESTYYFSIKF